MMKLPKNYYRISGMDVPEEKAATAVLLAKLNFLNFQSKRYLDEWMKMKERFVYIVLPPHKKTASVACVTEMR